jgi:hypothetical protein
VVQSSASLGIDDLFVIMYAKPPFWFDIRFLLRETGGTSGATLQTVFVGDHSGGGELAWVECWRDPLRVPPGGTLDTFYTQAGWDWLSYCGPWYGGAVNTHNLTAPVTIHVTFLDDEGRPGVYNFRGEARLIVER